MSAITRRNVVRSAAWSVPVIAVVAPIPAFATSIRKDPGINGWVRVATDETATGGTYDVDFDSTVSGVGPDGAPFGLYVYDVNQVPNDKFQNARITIWINDTQSAVTQTPQSGHGASWVYAGSVGSQTKPDGYSYTGYRYNYSGSILASSYVTDPSDGAKRLYLDDFHVSMRANQNSNNASANLTYWVERYIEIQSQGVGPYVARSFQRRNGQRGPLGNGFPGGGSFRRAIDAGLSV